MELTDPLRLKAKLFRGFGDPARLAILATLESGEKNVSEIVEMTGLSQPNVSSHLACLRECGLVRSEQRGRRVYYDLFDPEKVAHLLRIAEEILADVSEQIFACTRY